MKEYTDPVSRITFRFNEGEVISVFLRRSNGKKRVVFSSRSPEKSFNLYNSLKLFKGDRKYIETKQNDKIIPLLAESGKEYKALKPRLGVKGEHNFRYSSIPAVPRVPKTLNDDLLKILNAQNSRRYG